MSTPTSALDPKRTALLVMDFQQGIVQRMPDRLMHHEDPSTAIHDALAPESGDIVVRKIRVGGRSRRRDPRLPARQGLPAAGADHRHRHAPRPAGTVDSRA